VGRILLAAIFIISGAMKIQGFDGVVGAIASKGLPMPQVAAVLTIILELGGGLMIAVGFKARWTAVVFVVWLIPRPSSSTSSGGSTPRRQNQMNNFLKNVSIMGGMLLLAAYGPGAYSLDKR
jgi:putative oxidoreductase